MKTKKSFEQKKKMSSKKSCENALKRQYFDKCPSAEREIYAMVGKMREPFCNRIIFMQTILFLHSLSLVVIIVNELLILWIFDAANECRRFVLISVRT